MNYVDELLPDLLLQAPDVSDTALRRALQLAAQDYFRESEVWRPEFEPVLTFGGVNRYDMMLPTGTRIARILWVHMEDRTLEPLDDEAIARDAEEGYMVANADPHEIVLTTRTPRGYLKFGAALYPTPATEELPEWLIHDFRSPLVSAALARIYGSPGSPWFDPALAQQLAVAVTDSVIRHKRLSANRKTGTRRTVRYGGY